MGSSYVTTHTSPQELRRRNERLPLAITIHYNWFLSLTFAIIAGCLAFEKNSLFYCNSFQRLLLRPTFSIWLITELPRLYLGQKGVLSDKVSRQERMQWQVKCIHLNVSCPQCSHYIATRACSIFAAVFFPPSMDSAVSRFSSRDDIANRHNIRWFNDILGRNGDYLGMEMFEGSCEGKETKDFL